MKTRKINRMCLLLALGLVPLANYTSAFAATSGNVNFNVNINEVLTVSLTTPDNWASGNPSSSADSGLLRNKVVLNVSSNNGAGFTASMRSKTTTNLVNTSKASATIPTLASGTTAGSFPVNRWGYSINDTDAGTTSANYAALKTTAITVLNPTAPGSASKDIFFGAKADVTKDSGTYANTVIFSVVSGVIDDGTNPVIPDDPAVPSDDTPNDGAASYDTGSDRTVYTSTTSGSQTSPVSTTTTTTTTQVSSGDTRSSYTTPHGVTSNVGGGTPLAVGLAIGATAAAATGGIFFIIAKRKKDDDDEEEEQQ